MIFYTYCKVCEGKSYKDNFGNIKEIIGRNYDGVLIDKNGKLWTDYGTNMGVPISQLNIIKLAITSKLYRLFEL
jgi:hypothetical protein